MAFELANFGEEESAGAKAGALSFDCERDATTIEPLVNGQQLIAPLGAGAGIVNSVNSLLLGHFTECVRFSALCFALQHSCASIDADMWDIACCVDGPAESISLIEARA